MAIGNIEKLIFHGGNKGDESKPWKKANLSELRNPLF